MLDRTSIPSAALEVYEKRDMFLTVCDDSYDFGESDSLWLSVDTIFAIPYSLWHIFRKL